MTERKHLLLAVSLGVAVACALLPAAASFGTLLPATGVFLAIASLAAPAVLQTLMVACLAGFLKPTFRVRLSVLRFSFTLEDVELDGYGLEFAGHWMFRWLLPFVTETTLWPVLLVLMAHAAAFAAAAILLAIRERRLAALAALAALVTLTILSVGKELGRRRRVGALNGVVLATWMLSAALAVLADRYGLF